MISGRNKLTFVDTKSGSSKTIVKKRPGLLSLNLLYTRPCCSGSPGLACSRTSRSLRHSCRSWFRASCVRNLSMFSLFWFPTFCASQRVLVRDLNSRGLLAAGNILCSQVLWHLSPMFSLLNVHWIPPQWKEEQEHQCDCWSHLSLFSEDYFLKSRVLWRGLLFACINLYVMLVLHQYVI